MFSAWARMAVTRSGERCAPAPHSAADFQSVSTVTEWAGRGVGWSRVVAQRACFLAYCAVACCSPSFLSATSVCVYGALKWIMSAALAVRVAIRHAYTCSKHLSIRPHGLAASSSHLVPKCPLKLGMQNGMVVHIRHSDCKATQPSCFLHCLNSAM